MPEPITTTIGVAIAKGVAVKAITSLAGNVFKLPEYKETLMKVIDKSIDETSYVFEWNGSQRVEEVSLFLDSPEVQQLVEQMFSVKALEKDSKSFDEIENEFILLFEVYFGKILKDDKTRIKALFRLLLENVVNAIDSLIEGSENRMFLSLLNYQNNRLESLIQSISKNIDFLKQKKLANLKDIIDFEEKYRSQLCARFSFVKLSNLDTERKIYINDIYVNPKFSEHLSLSQKFSEILELSNFALNLPFGVGGLDTLTSSIFNETIKASTKVISDKYRINHSLTETIKHNYSKSSSPNLSQKEIYEDLHRVVILGNPGGGKSTFTYKICTDLQEHYKEGLINNKQLSPIYVKVRDYGEQKSKNNLSIIQFMELISNSSYQLLAPIGGFEYLLHNGRALVIFDGLDELLNTSYRKEIVEDIESFCNLYPATPILITSREVGYEQAPISKKDFKVFRLASFDDKQVEEYAHKYFDLEEHFSKEQKIERAKSFLRESEIAKDLRSNPLMLGLMCSIYRGERYIPQNRPQLYEKCSVMLFERWDKSRGINYPYEKFAAHIKPGMMFLAHWIYTTENLQSGVKGEQLIEKTADYLEAYYPNRNEAEFVAKDFVEFCSGRAWVFTDIGQGIYQFTHQTFLEYFTARYLNQTHRTPKEIAKIILPKIEKREWDVVAHLTLNILNDNPTEIADEIISIFLDNFEKKKRYSTRLNILSFVASSLDYAVLTYKTVQRIVETCIDFLVASILKETNSSKSEKENIPLDLINLLFLRDSRNKESIWKITEDYLLNEIKTSDEKRKKIIIHLIAYIENSFSSKSKDARRKLLSPPDKLTETIKQLSEEQVDNAIIKLSYNLIDIEQLIELHGLNALHKVNTYFGFIKKEFDLGAGTFIYRYLLRNYPFNVDLSIEEIKSASDALSLIAEKYSSNNHLKFKISKNNLYGILSLRSTILLNLLPLRLIGNELFGAFLFIAPIAELLTSNQLVDSEDIYNLIGNDQKIKRNLNDPPVKGEYFFIFFGRLAFDEYKEQIEFEIDNSALTETQKSIIWRWIHKEISFLE